LLFIAAEWERKGGDLAIEIVRRIAELGLDVRLTLVGAHPPRHLLPSMVQGVGFLDKADPSATSLLADLLDQSHVLLLPSLSDCTPVVLSEAAAFGVPALTSAVGGIPSIIVQGKNGFCISTHTAEEYVSAIERLGRNREAWAALASTSRSEYERRLNWETSAGEVEAILGAVTNG
jgi:glycosyltransferase involved in cell wall biosynthesis